VAESRLTEDLWAVMSPFHERILEHPFVIGLTSGSLERSAFRHYVVQDAHYLVQFARALSVLSARAPGEDEVLMFAQHAAGALEVERQLHEGFFQDFGMSPEEVRETPVGPTTMAYTSYLLAVAHVGSFPEALAAVLPCYWIYWEVGKALVGHGSPDPLYQRWIATYGGDEFGDIVRAVLALTDRLGDQVARAERHRMAEHAAVASRYEWMFWDAGLRRERWPV
jgi:thiaminase/transcriptional activator TenA